MFLYPPKFDLLLVVLPPRPARLSLSMCWLRPENHREVFLYPPEFVLFATCFVSSPCRSQRENEFIASRDAAGGERDYESEMIVVVGFAFDA